MEFEISSAGDLAVPGPAAPPGDSALEACRGPGDFLEPEMGPSVGTSKWDDDIVVKVQLGKKRFI